MSDKLNEADLQRRMSGAIHTFKHELSGLRTGRASPNLLDAVLVSAYGSEVPLNQVANVTVAEPRMLSVSVWDKTMVSSVDKAIRESKLNLNPIVEGTLLRIPLPELNEERRRDLVKVAHQYAEQARIAVRHVRRDGIDHLKKLEKDSELSKDDVFHASEKVQKLTDKMIAEIDNVLSEKEAEIMSV